MKLSYQQIKEFTIGAVEIWEEVDGLHFMKCTCSQEQTWRKLAPEVALNVPASTGVRIDFHTDSEYVAFEVSGGKTYEMRTDGQLTHKFVADEENRCATYRIELGKPGVMKRITFSMPSHNPYGSLKSVEVADGAKLQRHVFDCKVLFIGDSITQGWNSNFDQMSYAYQVSYALNAESIIQGIGGAFFAPETIEKLDFKPDIVFVAYGTNDFGHYITMEEGERQAQESLRKIKEFYADAKIYVITPIWRQDYHIARPMGDFYCWCNRLMDLAESMDFTVIKGNDLVPHLGGFFADDVHPNDLGFTMYAKNLLEAIK